VLAVPAVVEECTLRAAPTVVEILGTEAIVGVDEVNAEIAIESERAKLAIMEVDGSVAIPQVLALVSRVAEVAILAVPPVVRVLAVLVSRADVVRDGTLLEELPHLREEWA
jgi:hypothetical protein